MRISDILKAFATELERDDNEALQLAESDDLASAIVASALVQAAQILKSAADEVDVVEPVHSFELTPVTIDEMAAVAESFDASGDPLLQKQAAVLDEILMTIAAPRGAKRAAAEAMDARLEELKKKYQGTKEDLDKQISAADSVKKIQDSPYYKQYRILEAPLSTRHCPDHAGVMLARVAENQYQCALDKKVYNYETGYKTEKGNTVPGGSVENQTQPPHNEAHPIFDTRDSRLGIYYGK